MLTVTEIAQAQTDQVLAFAKQLDERGYALMVHRLNPEGHNHKNMYGPISGAIAKLLVDTYKGGVAVHLWPEAKSEASVIAGHTKLLDTSFMFTCRIPNRVGYRPLHAMLEMTATVTIPAKVSYPADRALASVTPERTFGSGSIRVTRKGDWSEILGRGRNELGLLIKIFDMPGHREILRGERLKCRIGK